MTRKQKLAWGLLPAVALVTLGAAAIQSNIDAVRDAGRFLLLPGFLLREMLGGGPYPGLSGVLDWIAVTAGSVAGWAAVSHVLISTVQSLSKPDRPNPSPRRRLVTNSVMCAFFSIAFLFLVSMYIRVHHLPSPKSSRMAAHGGMFRSPNGTLLSGLCAILCGREVWLAARACRKKREHKRHHGHAAYRRINERG